MRITQSFTKPDRWHPTTSEAYSDDNGRTWRWPTNDRLVPMDCCRDYSIPCDVAAQRAGLDEELTAFVQAYRKSYRGPSAEERAEARAAHGAGVTLVNVLTGHKWTT